MNLPKDVPKNIRVSLGSAIVLGLLEGRLDAAPTTAYLMTYRDGKCTANCGFCPQAQKSQGNADKLSRVTWPIFPTEQVLKHIEKPLQNGKISRVCLQALNYPEVFAHLTAIVKAMRHKTNLPISISCQPLNERNMGELAKAGVERIGIPLDAATKDLFDKVKGMSAGGPYDWDRQFRLLDTAGRVFGKGNVSTHLIVGLGETEEEMIRTIQRCVDIGVLPGLFAFTPIVGTALENKPPPKIEAYRRVQMARHLIVKGIVKCDDMCFDKEGCIIHFGVAEHALQQIADSGEPFLTSGCPNCNRPYYNEKPSGPIYNYPKGLTNKEIALVQKELGFEEA